MLGSQPVLVDRVLEAARRHLGMDVAYLSELTDSEQVVRVVAGAGEPLGVAAGLRVAASETFCHRLVSGELPAAVPDTRAHPCTRSLPASERIGAYVGVPVFLRDGHLYGTLCCAAGDPQRGLTSRDAQFLHVLAEVLASALDELRLVSPGHDAAALIDRIIDQRAYRLVFQPIVELAAGTVVGSEALTRFPAGSPPVVVFGEAARLGRSIDLESAVVKAAVSQLDRLPDGTYLSVNASPDMVVSGALAASLGASSLARTVIEITEHVAVDSYDDLRAGLEPLVDRGARVAIDDTGAGFASFRHVVKLSPDIIKLDVSLVSQIGVDPIEDAFASSVCMFAARIGATVVAEGVETRDAMRALRVLGVGCAQGYLFDRPGRLPLPRTRYELLSSV